MVRSMRPSATTSATSSSVYGVELQADTDAGAEMVAAKAWHDVRAGGFMHPVGANRAAGLLARTALGAPLD